jgi:hypothetical protein
MVRGNINIEIDGLSDLVATLNPKRINSDIAKGLGLATKTLHATLKHSISQTYNTSHNLDSVLVGKSISNVTFGKNIIESGLEYRYRPVDLAKFDYTWEMGNIPPLPKKRQGRVHSVTVKRASGRKIVYGKSGNGGFTQKNSRYGTQMFERMGKERKPLRLLFGPSLTDMVLKSLDTDPKVKKSLDAITDYIIEVI